MQSSKHIAQSWHQILSRHITPWSLWMNALCTKKVYQKHRNANIFCGYTDTSLSCCVFQKYSMIWNDKDLCDRLIIIFITFVAIKIYYFLHILTLPNKYVDKVYHLYLFYFKHKMHYYSCHIKTRLVFFGWSFCRDFLVWFYSCRILVFAI